MKSKSVIWRDRTQTAEVRTSARTSAAIQRREFLGPVLRGGVAATLFLTAGAAGATPARPNILWITSEDNMPLFGCYGDPLATTPNLDKLATESVRYTAAFANAPVCAPTRFTILTGTYAAAMGTQEMRSRYPIPERIKPYPVYLRAAGYYCANRSKTDYNFLGDDKAWWDECSAKAHYRNRAPGQPFFAVFNFTTTHESSSLGKVLGTTHDPAKVQLPPYHPDTPVIRNKWAQYYDTITQLDEQVGQVLRELDESGLADDTIVFYYSDHGGVLPRSKRFLYETGTRVPLLIRFPKKFQHLAPSAPGTTCDRLVSFVDFAPTLLSLVGLPVPGHMQGRAFLGAATAPAAEHVFLFRGRMDDARIDLSRALRGERYRYIRNYYPHRPHGLFIDYMWRSAAMRSWEDEYQAGRCNAIQSRFFQRKPVEELYDVAADPWEINNLAGETQYRSVLEKMRAALSQQVRAIRDAGFLPETEVAEFSRQAPVRDLVERAEFPLDRIIATAELASWGEVANLPELQTRLADAEPAVRYWAVVGCVNLGTNAAPAAAVLRKCLTDKSGAVRVAAAEALIMAGETQTGLPVLMTAVQDQTDRVRFAATDALSALAQQSPALAEAINAALPPVSGEVARALRRGN